MFTECERQESTDSSKDLGCPVSFVLDILSRKWTVQILREIFVKPTRTRKFLRAIPGLSMKALSERLKDMEKSGIVKRTVYPERVLKVEYSLTEKGRDLYEVLLALKKLGSRWLNTDCICSFELDEDGNPVCVDCPHRGVEASR